MFWIKITLNIVLLIILIYLTYTNDNLKQNKLFWILILIQITLLIFNITTEVFK